jgi:hypothetical protein
LGKSEIVDKDTIVDQKKHRVEGNKKRKKVSPEILFQHKLNVLMFSIFSYENLILLCMEMGGSRVEDSDLGRMSVIAMEEERTKGSIKLQSTVLAKNEDKAIHMSLLYTIFIYEG